MLWQRFSTAINLVATISIIAFKSHSQYRRRQIRAAPPNAILTNPEMLHLSFLAYHRKWQEFFKDLQTVVVDEVHPYRGVMGSHVAQIFRRFHRICRFSSATVAEPAILARQLPGLAVPQITQSGAPRWDCGQSLN